MGMEAKGRRKRGWCAAFERVIVWSIAAACVGWAVVSIRVLVGGGVLRYDRAWPLPYARMAIELDGLSAWFMLPLSIVGAAGQCMGRSIYRMRVGARGWQRGGGMHGCWQAWR